ncbi:MAG: polyphenol oxidase family protein [Acidobacteria bacterium]|nr:polyphenol oxidase family protein [Acidobacteriota bacterium]MCA1650051.1 polyphenol oxidase family protein [Acidobacteriota bacterium]
MSVPQPSGGFTWTQAGTGPALLCAPLQSIASHQFTTRALQLRDHDGEWDAVAGAVGVARAALRLIRQVHGTDVAVARRGDSTTWDPPLADIILSDDPGVAIGVRVADCAPVLIADRRLGIVGAAHAGWRGTAQGVAGVAVSALGREFGSQPGDLVAAIGPCLGPCCGEVGDEVPQAFLDHGHSAADIERWFRRLPGRRPHFDLWRANRDQLEAAGVLGANIYSADLCTKTHPMTFHSYRVDGPNAGRMVGVIRKKG